MITAYLQGGLGNQIFQVAAAYNLAKENNDEACFNFNSSHTPLQGEQAHKYKRNIFKEFTHKNVIDFKEVFEEQGHSYKKIEYKKDLLIKGYFQSEKYFLKNKQDVVDKLNQGLNEFKPQVRKYLDSIPGLKVAVHIRRGDYLNNPSIHPTCTKEYYQKALESFSFMKYTPIFVSDDIKWCKENFKGEFSPFKDELEDLTLLSMCNDNIIANSTFSWWGAYLNQSKIKVVVSPKQWFGENGPQDTQDIIPNNWIKI